jgi:ribosomal protein S4
MRGMSNYYFRGFRVLLNFSFRLDFYILRLFGIKNLKFARTLIKSGHVFVGNSVSNNTYTIAPRFSILSISKRATLWLTKQSYLRYFKVNEMESSQKKRFRTLKSTSLKFCRQHRDLNFWGSLKNTRYAMFYGELVDVLNTDQKNKIFFT